MPSRAGQGHVYPPSSSGRSRRRICHLKETLLRRRSFIRSRPTKFLLAGRSCKCLATFGNGPVVHILLTQGTCQRLVRLVNTTANSCATSMCSAGARAPLHSRTFEKPTAIFSRQPRDGSSRESVWPKTQSSSATVLGEAENLHRAMKTPDEALPALHNIEPSFDAFCDEILAGLSERPKRIAPKFFYDETGCRLFDEICRLDEYYLTRTEIGILRKHVTEICALLGPECRLVELGSGSNLKTRILLDHLRAPAAYVPVDIARAH